MHTIDAPYANKRPPLPQKVVRAKREKRKDEKLLKEEMKALLKGSMDGDNGSNTDAVQKAERIAKAQQKAREENALKAKQEAERREKQEAKLKKREQRAQKKKELLDKKKAKLRKEKMKEALKLENKRKRKELKLKRSMQRAAKSGGESSSGGKKRRSKSKQTFSFKNRRK
eukprot:g2595.t1